MGYHWLLGILEWHRVGIVDGKNLPGQFLGDCRLIRKKYDGAFIKLPFHRSKTTTTPPPLFHKQSRPQIFFAVNMYTFYIQHETSDVTGC